VGIGRSEYDTAGTCIKAAIVYLGTTLIKVLFFCLVILYNFFLSSYASIFCVMFLCNWIDFENFPFECAVGMSSNIPSSVRK
jgi:hypothetical protein